MLINPLMPIVPFRPEHLRKMWNLINTAWALMGYM